MFAIDRLPDRTDPGTQMGTAECVVSQAKAREAKSMNRAEQLVSECDAAVMVLGDGLAG